MSRNIQILSVPNRGNLGITVKGEPRKINFVDKGIVSVAMCDHDEAEKLLGMPGKGYWKDTPIELGSSQNDGPGPKETDAELAERLRLEAEQAETERLRLETEQAETERLRLEAEQNEAERLSREKEKVTTLTRETYAAMTQVTVLRKELAACTDKELIAALIQIEAGAEKPRDKWLEALSARLTELG
jgi:hypothetical protein